MMLKCIPEFLHYWQDIMGAIIGSLLAGSIAIWSIYRTHKNQKNLENEKSKETNRQKEKIYYGYLYSIWAIMKGHKSFLESLKKEVSSILKDYKEFGSIPYDKTYNVLPIELLKDSYLKILSYGNYKMDTVNMLVTYLSVNDSLLNELNFYTIKKLKDEMPDKKTYDSRVNFYFNGVFHHLDMLLETANNIENEIRGEMNNSEVAAEFIIEASKLEDRMMFTSNNPSSS